MSSESRFIDSAEDLATRLNVVIPGDILFVEWPLPLLTAIVDRIEKIEERLDRKDKQGALDDSCGH